MSKKTSLFFYSSLLLSEHALHTENEQRTVSRERREEKQKETEREEGERENVHLAIHRWRVSA